MMWQLKDQRNSFCIISMGRMIEGYKIFFSLFSATFCDSEAKQKSLPNLKIILHCPISTLVNRIFFLRKNRKMS